MISKLHKANYMLQLEAIRRRMANNKVKPINTQTEVTNEDKQSDSQKQSK
jgi:hypothetical protein